MNKFMKAAIKEAEKGINDAHGGPFGCVITKDGKIVAKGHNEVLKNNDPTCHGEMVTIRKACKKLKTFDLSGCELYTTGEPCPMCLGGILWANIDKVYFGCNITDAEDIGFRDSAFYDLIGDDIKLHEKVVELDRKECRKLFDRYKELSPRNY